MIMVCLFDTKMLNILTINLDLCAIFQKMCVWWVHCIQQMHSLLYTRMFGILWTFTRVYILRVNYLKTHKSLREIVVHCPGGRERESKKSNCRKSAETITWFARFIKASWWSIRAISCNFINHIECVAMLFRMYVVRRAGYTTPYRLHFRVTMSKVMCPVDKIKCARVIHCNTLFYLSLYFLQHIRHLCVPFGTYLSNKFDRWHTNATRAYT